MYSIYSGDKKLFQMQFLFLSIAYYTKETLLMFIQYCLLFYSCETNFSWIQYLGSQRLMVWMCYVFGGTDLGD